MKAIRSYYIVLALAFLYGCTETPVYQKSYSFNDKQWSRDEKPEFDFIINDTEAEYDFTLTLRTTTDYKFSDLWIFLKTETPDGVTAREPFKIPIADENGAWIGNKSGSVVETPLNFRRRKLPSKGTYKFIVELGVTQSTINEVLDLSFTVDKASADN